MTPSSPVRPLPEDRPAVGPLLVRLLHRFRREVFEVAHERGFGDIREAHLQVFGNVGVDGIRLTALAARANLSLAAAAELVDDLQRRGYLERVPDPTDGRARLIRPTPLGREALAVAGHRVAEIETRWGDLVGETTFEEACRTLDRLLATLDAEAEQRDRAR
jgi:DNA-binding MarR family transcriptional regulator